MLELVGGAQTSYSIGSCHSLTMGALEIATGVLIPFITENKGDQTWVENIFFIPHLSIFNSLSWHYIHIVQKSK